MLVATCNKQGIAEHVLRCLSVTFCMSTFVCFASHFNFSSISINPSAPCNPIVFAFKSLLESLHSPGFVIYHNLPNAMHVKCS